MRIDTEVLSNDKIMEYISKTEKSHWCVFIMPNELEVSPIQTIVEKNLICSDVDIVLGHMIIETYDNDEESINRVMQFRGEWVNQFYVCCYKNGEFIAENT